MNNHAVKTSNLTKVLLWGIPILPNSPPELITLKTFCNVTIIKCIVLRLILSLVDSGGRTIQGVGSLPVDWWDRGFDSRWRYACSSLVFVVWYVGSGLSDVLITRSEESYRVCVCDLETSKSGCLDPIRVVAPQNRKYCPWLWYHKW
jgi:hypothetical protein